MIFYTLITAMFAGACSLYIGSSSFVRFCADDLRSIKKRGNLEGIGCYTISRGIIKTTVLTVDTSLTPDQYFWYICWVQHLMIALENGVFLRDESTFVLDRWTLSSGSITSGDVHIKPIHAFIVSRGVVLTGLYVHGGRINLSNCDIVKLLAVSLALDPASQELIY